MKALILAGGLGLRLRPLVMGVPKPMARFAGRPFLEYQLLRLREQEFTEVVLCTGYLASQIREHFGDGRALGMKISHSIEEHLLGTGGAILNARDQVEGSFLVLNGDSFLELEFRLLAAFHAAHHRDAGAVATLVAVSVGESGACGSLLLDEDGLVCRFVEKAAAGPGWINGGAYIFEPELFECIPAGEAVSLEYAIFPALAARNRGLLWGYRFDGFFVDIGTPAGHQRFALYTQQPGGLDVDP